MEEIVIKLPEHAVRYLKRMLELERKRISNLESQVGHSLQSMAAYDSINAIESALP